MFLKELLDENGLAVLVLALNALHKEDLSLLYLDTNSWENKNFMISLEELENYLSSNLVNPERLNTCILFAKNIENLYAEQESLESLTSLVKDFQEIYENFQEVHEWGGSNNHFSF